MDSLRLTSSGAGVRTEITYFDFEVTSKHLYALIIYEWNENETPILPYKGKCGAARAHEQ